MSNEIKNGDLPAMPSDIKIVFEAMTSKQDRWCAAALGMTKRETIAMHIHAALLSACDSAGEWSGTECRAAKIAVKEADELLAELERTK